jgi:hypothetical protein
MACGMLRLLTTACVPLAAADSCGGKVGERRGVIPARNCDAFLTCTSVLSLWADWALAWWRGGKGWWKLAGNKEAARMCERKRWRTEKRHRQSELSWVKAGQYKAGEDAAASSAVAEV